MSGLLFRPTFRAMTQLYLLAAHRLFWHQCTTDWGTERHRPAMLTTWLLDMMSADNEDLNIFKTMCAPLMSKSKSSGNDHFWQPFRGSRFFLAFQIFCQDRITRSSSSRDQSDQKIEMIWTPNAFYACYRRRPICYVCSTYLIEFKNQIFHLS